jgi:hypothetical protein
MIHAETRPNMSGLLSDADLVTRRNRMKNIKRKDKALPRAVHH